MSHTLECICGDAWVAQSVDCPTLDFGSGHDPRVMGSSPTWGSVLSMEPVCDSISLSLCLPPSHALSLSPSLSNKKEKNAMPHGSIPYTSECSEELGQDTPPAQSDSLHNYILSLRSWS